MPAVDRSPQSESPKEPNQLFAGKVGTRELENQERFGGEHSDQ